MMEVVQRQNLWRTDPNRARVLLSTAVAAGVGLARIPLGFTLGLLGHGEEAEAQLRRGADLIVGRGWALRYRIMLLGGRASGLAAQRGAFHAGRRLWWWLRFDKEALTWTLNFLARSWGMARGAPRIDLTASRAAWLISRSMGAGTRPLGN
jgi:hypothetical protein